MAGPVRARGKQDDKRQTESERERAKKIRQKEIDGKKC